MSEFNANKYRNDFNKEKYDRLSFLVPKGQGAVIKEYAKAHGFKSANNFIWECVRNAMENNARNINVGDITQNGDGNSINIG